MTTMFRPFTRIFTADAPAPKDRLGEALQRGDVQWDDLVAAGPAALRAAPATEPAPAPTPAPTLFIDRATTQLDLIRQPFALRLLPKPDDAYDTRAMSDADWETCMKWVYLNGWVVMAENRAGFQAKPATLPPRKWTVSPAGTWGAHIAEMERIRAEAAAAASGM